MIIRYIFTLTMAFIIISFISLFWPKLTSAEVPPVLAGIRSYVLNSALGYQSAQILGVTNEQKPRPVDPQELLSGAVGSVVKIVQNRTKEVIFEQAKRQLIKQLDDLPEDQKKEIESAFCQSD